MESHDRRKGTRLIAIFSFALLYSISGISFISANDLISYKILVNINNIVY